MDKNKLKATYFKCLDTASNLLCHIKLFIYNTYQSFINFELILSYFIVDLIAFSVLERVCFLLIKEFFLHRVFADLKKNLVKLF